MGQMIQLSEAASIALHSVAFMARSPGDYFTARQIAASSGASENHIAKVLQRLVKSGILRSVRGPHGGFTLARPAEELTFLEIYETIEGRVAGGACPLHRGTCPFSRCIFGGLLNRVNAEVVDYFRSRKISDFV
ncbi:RrF2 family transcriptional regulator [Salinispira pacifica]